MFFDGTRTGTISAKNEKPKQNLPKSFIISQIVCPLSNFVKNAAWYHPLSPWREKLEVGKRAPEAETERRKTSPETQTQHLLFPRAKTRVPPKRKRETSSCHDMQRGCSREKGCISVFTNQISILYNLEISPFWKLQNFQKTCTIFVKNRRFSMFAMTRRLENMKLGNQPKTLALHRISFDTPFFPRYTCNYPIKKKKLPLYINIWSPPPPKPSLGYLRWIM